MKYTTLLTSLVAIHILTLSTLTYSSKVVVQAIPLIESIEVDVKENETTVHIDINKEFADKYLNEASFYATYHDVDLSEVPESILTVPFLTNIFAIVLFSGKKYTIPEMDARLYDSFGKISKVFRRLYPNTKWDGELVTQELVKNDPIDKPLDPTEVAALLFSGGIDSTSAAYELQAQKLKLLLIMMRGQGAHILKDDDLWNKQSTLSKNFAKEHEHDISFLTSNYHSILNLPYLASLSPEVNDWRVDAIEDMGMWGNTAPLLYLYGIGRLYMASSRDWSYPYISIGNPLADRLMGFGNDIELRCSQFNFSRIDKIEHIISQVKSGLKPPLIHVCYRGQFPSCAPDDQHNLECRKCMPTALGFLALGADPRDFGFDVTDEELIEIAKKYLAKTQPHITLWQLLQLQEKLKEQDSSNEKFAWFLEADLAAYVDKDYIAGKPDVSWDDLRDLAPEDLEIPYIKKKVLIVLEKE